MATKGCVEHGFWLSKRAFEQLGARKRVTDFRKGQHLGEHDHLIELTKPVVKPDWMKQEEYNNAPAVIVLRELKVNGKILIRTLLSAKNYPKDELKTLYKERWHIEVDLRNIKTTLGMEKLSCKTPAMVEKEMWVYFLAYNLIRLLMAQSALLTDVLPRQVSFKHTVKLWLTWGQQTQAAGIEADESILFMLIAQKTVGNRPGRVEPRTVKQMPKPFPLLMEKREQVRKKIKKTWTSKKV